MFKNSSYLQEGLLPASPFLHQEGGIAMTCDGSLSFSNSLSCMISGVYSRETNESSIKSSGRS